MPKRSAEIKRFNIDLAGKDPKDFSEFLGKTDACVHKFGDLALRNTKTEDGRPILEATVAFDNPDEVEHHTEEFLTITSEYAAVEEISPEETTPEQLAA